MTLTDIGTSVGLLLVGGVVSWFVTAKATAKTARVAANKETLEKIQKLEVQLAQVQQSVVPMSAAFQAILIKELTHYHTPVMDALLQKLGPPNTLTEAEEDQLIAALKQRTKDMGDLISDSERVAAALLPLVMKRVHLEEISSTTVQLQTVSVPEAPPEAPPEKK